MDLRGNVYGAIGYRFTKGLHLGLAQPKLFTRFNLVNVMTGYVNSVVVSLFLCFIGVGLSIVSKLGTPEAFSVSFIALFSTIAVFAILTPTVITAIAYLFRHGRDPSPFVATIVTGVGDVLTPAVLVAVAYSYEALPEVLKVLTVAASLSMAIALFAYMVHTRESKDLVENLLSSTIGSTGSSLGGFFLAMMARFIAENPEILGVLPAFNAVVGAAMGYLSNSINIDLHIGVERPRRSFYRKSTAVLVATYASVAIALVAATISSKSTVLRLPLVALCVTLSCLALYAVAALITYSLTMISFRRGWDPDNIVFPVMTTFVDLMGPATLSVTAILLLRA